MSPEFRRTIHLRPLPEEYHELYRKRGVPIPEACTPPSPAALVPYRFRGFHRRYAQLHGYFWLPCILCQEPHGGHEITASIPDPTGGPNRGVMICPKCSEDRAAIDPPTEV